MLLLTQAGEARFVAVGQDGHYQVSEDGTSWSGTLNVGINVDLDDIAHDGHQWIAVGQAGTIISSMDTETWEVVPIGITTDLTGIAYDGTSWRIVGDNGLAMQSDDGAQWTVQTTDTTEKLHSVAGNGVLWVAVGEAGTIITNDGSPTWMSATSPTAKPLYGIGTNGGTWVATGEEMTPPGSSPNYKRMFTSNDGANWTPRTTNTGGQDPQDVLFGSGRWHTGGGLPVTSLNNGATWTYTGLGSNTIAVAYGKGTWVLVSTSGSHKYSPNGGASWTTLSSMDLGANIREVAAARLSCAPATTSTFVNEATTLTADGGTGPYTWSAPNSILPTSGTTDTLLVMYAGTGSYEVTVRDASAPQQVARCSLTLPELECGPAWQATYVNEPVTLFATGGKPPYTWAAQSSSLLSTDGAAISLSYSQPETYAVEVTSSDNPPSSKTCMVVVNLVCRATASYGIAPGAVRVSVDGGVAPFNWLAPGARNPGPYQGSSWLVEYIEAGTYTITVRDSDQPTQEDTCVFTVGHEPQPDSDHDGVADAADNCASTPNAAQDDSDEDKQGDACDSQTADRNPPAEPPGPGAGSPTERFADTPCTGTTLQRDDLDGDGLAVECDPDSDGDGIRDTGPTGLLLDNCPTKANTNQSDDDQDGIGNACDGPSAESVAYAQAKVLDRCDGCQPRSPNMTGIWAVGGAAVGASAAAVMVLRRNRRTRP